MEELGFVKLPKEIVEIDSENSDSLVVAESELVEKDGYAIENPAFNLVLKCRSLEKKGPKIDPLIAIDAFILALDSGVYPPINVLNWLKESFEEFYKQAGGALAPKLDEILGVSGRKIFTEDTRNHRDELISKDMYILIKCFNLSDDKAAGFVSLKYSFLPKNPLFKLELSTRQIKNIFQEYEATWRGIFEYFPHPEKIGFLESFPQSVRNDIFEMN